MLKYRLDLVFSYWIFVWYLLYIFGFTNWNPKLTLITALIANIIILLFRILSKSISNIDIVIYIIIQVLIKIIPLYTLMNVKINVIQSLERDVLILLAYIFWVYINGSTALEIYKSHYSPLTNFIIDLFNKKLINK